MPTTAHSFVTDYVLLIGMAMVLSYLWLQYRNQGRIRIDDDIDFHAC